MTLGNSLLFSAQAYLFKVLSTWSSLSSQLIPNPTSEVSSEEMWNEARGSGMCAYEEKAFQTKGPARVSSLRLKHTYESESEVAQSYLTLCNPMDCTLPGSCIHRIFQARTLEWVAIFFSRQSSFPRDGTLILRIAGDSTIRATREHGTYIYNWLLITDMTQQNGSEVHYAQWEKPGTNGHILNDSIYGKHPE